MKEIKGLKSIRESFNTRQVKFGGFSVLITLAVAVSLVLLNLIIGRFTFQFDLTRSKLFSLSEQTIQVLDQIKSPVNIYGIWPPGQENADIKEVLDLYLARNNNLHYQEIDPDRNPGFLLRFDRERLGISTGSVIVEGQKGFRVIPPQDMFEISNFSGGSAITGLLVERRLTSALIYAETGETPVIYEIYGHQEMDLKSLGLGDLLDQENYELRQLNLTQSSIPADASVIVIISPSYDFTRQEADKLLDYLDRGGSLLIMADFTLQDNFMLNEVLAGFGLRFDYGIVMENDPFYMAGDLFMEVPVMGEHEITTPLMEKYSTVALPYVMGISETAIKRRSIGIVPLLFTSAASWLRSDISEINLSKIESDIAGPITIATAVTDPQYVEESEVQTRIVAIGASSVMNNMYGDISIFNQQFFPAGNIELFMNSITWLEGRVDTLSVHSKNVFIMPMWLTNFQAAVFGGIFVILIPLGFFITGLVVWLKRRHL